ncbi:lipopolysaccharide assembly LapA domain-containing protein [Paenibacillus massiliensis]|uniref:LapA family protein n=1 Tax=Paenibacillus massiliensis TaxID=225917 RepID=UPI000372F340|nr:lipopolysaccharide assembly protein LapA domain-containing protein [Paenibacillus massiliensis]
MKLQWSLIAALLIALITAVFAVINVNSVQVNLLFSVVSIPLILLILGCTLLGGLIVGSFGIFRQYRQQREIKILRNEVQALKAQRDEFAESLVSYEPMPAEPNNKQLETETSTTESERANKLGGN